MKIKIPSSVFEIILLIENNGYECYLVGGSVRDAILNKISEETKKEFDFATSATPSEIKKIFSDFKILDFGEKHGTVIIHKNGINYEITTYREEEDYSDGRRPDKVTFVKNIKSDLSRRDFTINALAADKSGEVLDLFSGIEDLNAKLIRTVGKPQNRFNEDSLRLFRAIRFAVRLNFKIEKNTYNALKENIHLILKHSISGERILTELKEIILYLPNGLKLLFETGLLKLLITSQKIQFSENQYSDFIDHISDNAELISKPNLLRNFALFLHPITVNKNDIIKIIDNFFIVYPGLGSSNITYIFQLISNYSIINKIESRDDINLLIRIIREIKWNLKNSKMIELSKFMDDLVEYYYISNFRELKILNLQNSNKNKTNLDLAISIIERKSPISGSQVKSLGFKGKQIGALLKIIQLWFDRDRKITQTDLFKKIEYHQNRPIIDLSIIKNVYSDDSGVYILNMSDLLIKELNLMEMIFKIKSGIFAILFSDDELKLVQKLLPFFNENDILVIMSQDSEISEKYRIAKNLVNLSIDFLCTKIIFVHNQQLKELELKIDDLN